jgi:hypothetical protein
VAARARRAATRLLDQEKNPAHGQGAVLTAVKKIAFRLFMVR